MNHFEQVIALRAEVERLTKELADSLDNTEKVSAGWNKSMANESRFAAYLGRIAEVHHQQTGEGGLTSGDCNECGWAWPCPTNLWATGQRQDGDTWLPADDAATDGGEPA